jgi:hypothetical protein
MEKMLLYNDSNKYESIFYICKSARKQTVTVIPISRKYTWRLVSSMEKANSTFTGRAKRTIISLKAIWL